MAQTAKKATKRKRPSIGKPMTREYLRGVRDTLRALFEGGMANNWQREDTARFAELVGVPFVYMTLLEDEGMTDPHVSAASIDEFHTWLDVNEIERDFALGEGA